MRGFNHATILSPCVHGLHKERLAQWPAFCDPKNKPKIPGSTSRKIRWGVQHATWNSYPISDQNLWFSLPYFRPDQKFDTLFQTLSPGARRVTGAHDKLLRHVHGSWRNPQGGGGVLPYITYTGMCRPMGSWFWSSWFRTGYPFQRRFLERGIKTCGSRLYLLLKIVADYNKAFI